MSNRIRILFHCDLEGQVAHVGQKALQAMEIFIRAGHEMLKSNPSGVAWVDRQEWLRRGRPPGERRILRYGAFGPVYQYGLSSGPSKAPKILSLPRFGNCIERAQWLWQNLPSEIRQRSTLSLVRESRKACWRRSRSNPHRYGWVSLKKGIKAIMPNNKWNWHTEAEYDVFEIHNGPVATTTLGNSVPAVPTPPVDWLSSIPATVAAHEAAAGLNSAPAQVSETPTLQKPPKMASKKTEKALYGSSYMKHVKAKTSSSSSPGLMVNADGDIVVAPEQEDRHAKPQPSKPKLRIGVWA